MSRIYLPKKTIAAPRMAWTALLLLAMFVAVVLAGYFRLQLLEKRLDERFFYTHHAIDTEPAHRGSIFGRDDSTALAMNSDTYHVALLPRLLQGGNARPEQYRRQAQALAEALEMDADEVERKMRADRSFLYLKKNVSAWVAEHINRLDINGVDTEYTSKRFYPDGMNFAHIIGYTDWQGIGRAGIEYVDHGRLDATDGEIRYIRAGSRGAVSELLHQPAVAGNNVHLTLDRRLQYVAFNALAAAAQKHGAKSASAVMMDVASGDILVLANYPSFNPNFIRATDRDNRINHALADQVEPGSTAKPFVAALALEGGLAQPQEIFPTKKALQVGRLRVHDKHIRDDLDVSGIIQKSSNVGAVLLARRAGAGALEDFYRALGIGGGRVLNLREEAPGVLRSSAQWRETDFATHAYGYGFSLTLPQLLRAYSVFATDGVLVSPRLWQRVPVAAKKRVLSPATAREVRRMMERVVSREGTASLAAVAGYRVAGKTGTVGKWTDGEFDLDRRRVFFVGMAPASDPRYLMAVMVDEPTKNGDSGGAVAAPVFGKIMRDALLFGGAHPDAALEEHVI